MSIKLQPPVEEIINPPDPFRTMEGLRDTGYQFPTALADIIDNSIAAKASLVDVTLEMEFDGEISVYVADNGTGMDRQGLIDAMKYGSPPRPDPASLGKFGLGLKTASTAFCRRLSLVSRPDGTVPALRATWDLDHVRETGAWNLQMSEAEPAFVQRLDAVTGGTSGTVVAWERVDRLLDREYSDPGGPWARKAFRKIEASLRDHISLVYQRFLDPVDDRARDVTVRVNGKVVDPWNPFEPVPESKLVAEDEIKVQMEDGSHASFTVRAFVLPHRDEVPEQLRHKARISNELQGIYVYRENRLIHGPDWLGMFGKEPHYSLLRVEFTFDHSLDSAFHIDIKKSQIILNTDLYDWLRDQFLGAPRRAANERYRRRIKEKTQKAAKSAHDASNNAIAGKEQDLGTATVDVVDPSTGTVRITTRDGHTTTAKLRILSPQKPGEVHVSPVEGLDDGLLWEPALIDGHKAVRLNTGHPYYNKVYVPNLAEGVTVQGMDSLLWALGAAETSALSPETQQHFEELRFEVSRLLRKLVADLPDPEDSVSDEPS
jgi:hypothetical protein